jgi:hypothetical protein
MGPSTTTSPAKNRSCRPSERGSKPASLSPLRTSLWIPYARRAAHSSRRGLGRNNRLSRASLVAWLRCGRSDGHGAAWNGFGLALGAGAYQAKYGGCKTRGALVASGAGTDHLPMGETLTLQDVTNAYLEQCEAIEAVGGRIILMASRALAAIARHAEDYAAVYASVLSQVRQPVILHWLGPMFDPALEGYWGSSTITAATENCLSIIRSHKETIDGIKNLSPRCGTRSQHAPSSSHRCPHVYRR